MMSRLGSPKGLFAFFEEDLEEADRALFGRESYPDRRCDSLPPQHARRVHSHRLRR
jgi:hypothetical protein